MYSVPSVSEDKYQPVSDSIKAAFDPVNDRPMSRLPFAIGTPPSSLVHLNRSRAKEQIIHRMQEVVAGIPPDAHGDAAPITVQENLQERSPLLCQNLFSFSLERRRCGLRRCRSLKAPLRLSSNCRMECNHAGLMVIDFDGGFPIQQRNHRLPRFGRCFACAPRRHPQEKFPRHALRCLSPVPKPSPGPIMLFGTSTRSI